jgi:hypothetical protein
VTVCVLGEEIVAAPEVNAVSAEQDEKQVTRPRAVQELAHCADNEARGGASLRSIHDDGIESALFEGLAYLRHVAGHERKGRDGVVLVVGCADQQCSET